MALGVNSFVPNIVYGCVLQSDPKQATVGMGSGVLSFTDALSAVNLNVPVRPLAFGFVEATL